MNKGESKECLFILTEKCYACILEYVDGKVSTRAYGDMKDKNFAIRRGNNLCRAHPNWN